MQDDELPSTQGPWLTIVAGSFFWCVIYVMAKGLAAGEALSPGHTAKARKGVILFTPIAQAVGTKGALALGALTLAAGILWLRGRNRQRAEALAERKRDRMAAQRQRQDATRKANERMGG